MESNVLSELYRYWNDTLLLQGQVNLIVSPVHEHHQAYNDLLFDSKMEVFRKGYLEGRRLVVREQAKHQYAFKEKKPIQIKHNGLFGTLENAERMLQDDTFTASEHTLKRVDESINEIITNGYREGKGIKQVANDIRERFGQLKEWESVRIARTEIHTAHSLGRREAYQEMGVNYTQWISAHDRKTRRSHALLDGEIIAFGGKYSNGLKYPGDKSGPIEEWINCRCSEAPYVMPLGMTAPPGMSCFRESDLIATSPPDTDDLLRKATDGALDWETFRKSLYDKTIAEELMLAHAKQEEEIKVKGLEDLETFKETLKKENRKLWNRCKKYDCFEEVYNLLVESQVSEYELAEVEIHNIDKDFKRDELKEYITQGQADLDDYDMSWKKFCEKYGLETKSQIQHALKEGIAEGGYTLAYVLEDENLILTIGF